MYGSANLFSSMSGSKVVRMHGCGKKDTRKRSRLPRRYGRLMTSANFFSLEAGGGGGGWWWAY